jgi:hypothetical protein
MVTAAIAAAQKAKKSVSALKIIESSVMSVLR